MTRTAIIEHSGLRELKKELDYLKKNMEAISKYEVIITGGHRKKLFRKEKTINGNYIIRALRKKGKDYMNNAGSIMSQAAKSLSSSLAIYVTPKKMNKENWSEIRELLRRHGRVYLRCLQSHWMRHGTGWNNAPAWEKRKAQLQANVLLPLMGMAAISGNLPGIFSGRTVMNMRVKLQNAIFRKSSMRKAA
ncbi:MAG: hypothetical protein PHV68_01980 [Candidatus Gastranaerophilales bacterium]|nr:hypothetical protein [Candidatus Gastranaerophilales bacterium]